MESTCDVEADRFDSWVGECGNGCGREVLLPLCFRLRNLAVRAETLEMMLPRVDDVSEKARVLLAESKILDESSDLTEE
jgi:hypothetical protein